MAWCRFRVASSAWDPTNIIRKKAQCIGSSLLTLQLTNGCNQCRLRQFRRGDRLCNVGRAATQSRGFPRCQAGNAETRFDGVPAALRAGRPAQLCQLVGLRPRRELAQSRGTGKQHRGARTASRRAGCLRRCSALRDLGRQGTADGSRMGVRRARRARRSILLLGQRDAGGWPPHGQHLAGRVSLAKLCTDGFERTAPVGSFPPNGYGLYDMAGNVWEWTSDWFAARHGRMRPNPAAFRRTRAAAPRSKATTRGSHNSASPARW